ncbi:MAG: hypothetical protein ACYS3N_06420 [Planctomycetota bacterium]|jgi:hypothetical protein
MKIKKLFVRMLVAIILGLCAGILMEFSSEWLVFPLFLIVGVLACIFVEIVIEVIRGTLTITREDLRKMKKPVLRILIATSIGLFVGIVLELISEWSAFPSFFILGVLLGIAAGIIIEFIKYRRSMKRIFLEGKGLGLEQLPVSTAELIRLVIKKMGYKREVRTEVMAELAAHFEDELKDFKTDEEKQRRAGQLIDDFGDTKLLAVLLRRAKIRCRPLWRTIVARTFQAVGALILCFIIYAVWFSTGKPTIRIDYMALLNQLNRPEVRDQDNAWPYYEKAIGLYVEPDERIQELTECRRKDFEKKLSFSDLDEEEQNKIQQWLKVNKSLWEDLDTTQKQLIERCFKEGFVPLTDADYLGEYSSKKYRVFDEAVTHITRRIERGESDDMLGYEYQMMMDMEMGMGYGYGLHFGMQRDIKLDTDIALDSEVISLFGSYSKDELKKIKDGIDVGVIKEWIESPPVVVKSMLDYLLPFEKKLIVKWVEENEAAWREFLAGSSKSYCYREYQYGEGVEDRFLWEISYSHFNSVRRLTRVGSWRSRIAKENGKIQQSVDDCLAIARAGSHWQGRGTLGEQLVGLAIGRIAHNEMFDVLATERFSSDELKRLQHQLSQLYPQGYPLIDMEGERIAFMDTIQRIFTEGGPGGGHLIPQKTGMFDNMYEDVVEITEDIPIGGRFVKNATLTSMCLLHARRDATIAAARQFYKQADMIAKMSPYARHERDVGSIEEVIVSMPRFRFALLEHLIPAAERISELLYQGKASHEATMAILVIQRWRLEKDGYPATLDELIEAGYLKELPKDPYSDKPIIYKKTGDNFVLYSIGRNFEDDGGKVFEKDGDVQKWGANDDGDAVFWPVAKLQ